MAENEELDKEWVELQKVKQWKECVNVVKK
jgi:hypothetical protein